MNFLIGLILILIGIAVAHIVYTKQILRRDFTQEHPSRFRAFMVSLAIGGVFGTVFLGLEVFVGLSDRGYPWTPQNIVGLVVVAFIVGFVVMLGTTWQFFLAGKYRDFLYPHLTRGGKSKQLSKTERSAKTMIRPNEVDEMIPTLAVNAIGLILVGLLFLLFGFTSSPRYAGGDFCVGALLLFMGIPLGILTIEFYRLRPWTYPFVKLFVSGPLRLKGATGFKEKITNPEVMRAFGLTPNDEQQHDNKQLP